MLRALSAQNKARKDEMVNRIESRGNQGRGNPIKLKMGEVMSGTPFPREGRHGDFWLVRVRGGIMGLLRDAPPSLDPNRNIRVSVSRIDEPDSEHPNRKYTFAFVSQASPTLTEISPADRVSAMAAPSASQASHIADKPIPSVGDLAAFRQYGEGLLRTNSRDSAQLKSSIKEWLGLAENISPRESAIDRLIDKLKRRIYADGSKRRTTFSWDW
jgi:hypothetical protein